MRKIFVLSLAFLFMLAIIFTVTSANGTARSRDSAKSGERLYRQNCAMCHKVDATGMCMAPSLIGVTERMDDEEIIKHARKIGRSMCCAQHILKLTDQEFENIVAHLHTLNANLPKQRK